MPELALTDWVLAADLALLIILLAVWVIHGLARSHDFGGRPPIARPAFVLGKLAMFATWAALPLSVAGVDLGAWEPLSWSRIAAAAALSAATLIVAASFIQLGSDNRFGLPRQSDGGTGLRTGGVYRFSRNPMYVGFFLMCAAACFRAPHPLTFVLAGVMAAVHHAVVRSEERFLGERYGEAWLAYVRTTRRYL